MNREMLMLVEAIAREKNVEHDVANDVPLYNPHEKSEVGFSLNGLCTFD